VHPGVPHTTFHLGLVRNYQTSDKISSHNMQYVLIQTRFKTVCMQSKKAKQFVSKQNKSSQSQSHSKRHFPTLQKGYRRSQAQCNAPDAKTQERSQTMLAGHPVMSHQHDEPLQTPSRKKKRKEQQTAPKNHHSKSKSPTESNAAPTEAQNPIPCGGIFFHSCDFASNRFGTDFSSKTRGFLSSRLKSAMISS
jgi:hypothetical protein